MNPSNLLAKYKKLHPAEHAAWEAAQDRLEKASKAYFGAYSLADRAQFEAEYEAAKAEFAIADDAVQATAI